MTRKEMAAIMARLRPAYQLAVIDADTVALFAEQLGKYEADEVQRAVLQHINASPKFPTVFDLRERIVANRAAANPGPPPGVPRDERVTQAEVRAAVNTLLSAWQQRAPR